MLVPPALKRYGSEASFSIRPGSQVREREQERGSRRGVKENNQGEDNDVGEKI